MEQIEVNVQSANVSVLPNKPAVQVQQAQKVLADEESIDFEELD